MPLSTPCPKCGRKLFVPQRAAGRAVTCPGCAARFTAPTPDEDGGFEVVDDPALPRRARRVTRPIADDEPDQPRPRRMPRRDGGRRRSRRSEVPPWAILTAAGVVTLGIVVIIMRGLFQAGPGLAAGLGVAGPPALPGVSLADVTGPPPPPGYTVAVSRDGSYRVFLPGAVTEKKFPTFPGVKLTLFGHSGLVGGEAHVSIESRYADVGSPPGLSFEQLTALAKAEPVVAPAFGQFRIEPEVKPITIGGRPGIMVRTEDNPHGALGGGDTSPPARAGSVLEQLRRNEAERVAKTGRRYVIVFATDGPRHYTITYEKPGNYFDEATIRTVIDSFRFL